MQNGARACEAIRGPKASRWSVRFRMGIVGVVVGGMLAACVTARADAREERHRSAAGSVADSIFTEVLRAHVSDGQVDYGALRNDQRLDRYLAALAQTDPDVLPDDDSRLAFWLNVYNAYTLDVVRDHYPIDSINDLHFGGLIVGTLLNRTVWDRDFVVINGVRYTLNEVEHEIIRVRFDEPRIHFALVCAAVSCPTLRREAYSGPDLDRQLDDQARRFLNDPARNRFDPARRRAELSKIFSWFGGDFGPDRQAILIYSAPYLDDDVAAAIRDDPGAWRVRFLKYDWSLND